MNKLQSATKNQTGVILRMNIKLFNENNLPHELLLITRQKAKLINAFKSNISTVINYGDQVSKIIHFNRFLGALLSKLAGPLMKVAVPLAKYILAPLGITAAVSVIDTGTQSKILDSGTKTLITSKEEMNYISKTFQSLKDSNILLKVVFKIIEIEAQKREDFWNIIRNFKS